MTDAARFFSSASADSRTRPTGNRQKRGSCYGASEHPLAAESEQRCNWFASLLDGEGLIKGLFRMRPIRPRHAGLGRGPGNRGKLECSCCFRLLKFKLKCCVRRTKNNAHISDKLWKLPSQKRRLSGCGAQVRSGMAIFGEKGNKSEGRIEIEINRT